MVLVANSLKIQAEETITAKEVARLWRFSCLHFNNSEITVQELYILLYYDWLIKAASQKSGSHTVRNNRTEIIQIRHPECKVLHEWETIQVWISNYTGSLHTDSLIPFQYHWKINTLRIILLVCLFHVMHHLLIQQTIKHNTRSDLLLVSNLAIRMQIFFLHNTWRSKTHPKTHTKQKNYNWLSVPHLVLHFVSVWSHIGSYVSADKYTF